MSKGECYDEEDAFLTEEATEKGVQYDKLRAQTLIAYSNLRSVSIAMLLCGALFLSILTLRLELSQKLKWPLYLDFIPLFIMSCLAYIAATDFAATRISSSSNNSALGKGVIIVTGFMAAFGSLMLAALICLRLTGVIDWRWTSVMAPFWMALFFSQFFFYFLIPGFINNNMLKMLFGGFLMLWMSGLVVLLAALKLDGELPGIHWWVLLTPIWAVLVGQIVFLEKRPIDVACRALLLASCILLPLRLDGTVKMLPWASILVPPVIVLMLNIVQIFNGIDAEL